MRTDPSAQRAALDQLWPAIGRYCGRHGLLREQLVTGRWGIPVDGWKITSLRGARMITRLELAKLADVSLDTVSKVENGARRVSPAVMAGLVTALGCPPERLFLDHPVK